MNSADTQSTVWGEGGQRTDFLFVCLKFLLSWSSLVALQVKDLALALLWLR